MKSSMSSFAGSKDNFCHSAYKAFGVLPLSDHLVVKTFFIVFAPSPSQAAGSGSSDVYQAVGHSYNVSFNLLTLSSLGTLK